MNVLNIDLTSEQVGDGRWRLYPVGDMHWDEKATDRDRFRRYRDVIADDPYGIWISVGDYVSGTTPGHHFYDPATVQGLHPDAFSNMDKYVAFMVEEIVAELGPLKHRPGIIIQGNHDTRSGIRWSGLAWAIANRLGDNVQYGGDEALLRVRATTNKGRENSRAVWCVHCAHGTGGGRMGGAKMNAHQRDIMSLTTAEIAVRGHVHDSLCRVLYLLDVSRRGTPRLVEKPRCQITAPGFMRSRTEGVTGYASTKTYPVNDAGLLFLEIHNPSRHGTHDGRIFRKECPF